MCSVYFYFHSQHFIRTYVAFTQMYFSSKILKYLIHLLYDTMSGPRSMGVVLPYGPRDGKNLNTSMVPPLGMVAVRVITTKHYKGTKLGTSK